MSDVPSNLIPTRLTQLPVAPVADENSLMMIVYQGNNYQIRVGDLLSVAGVPTSRQVIAGTGLQGGGQLSSNVTLSIAPGGVGSTELAASGVTPGAYGTATDVPVFTVDATGRVTAATTIPVTVSGYVPDTRQVIAGTGLSGGGALSGNVTLNANLSSATPQAGFQAGSAGVSGDISRADHQHPAVNLGVDDEVDGVLGLDNGGTARSIVPDAGAIIWCGADGLYVGPAGLAGQVLVSGGTGAYTWGSTLIVTDQPANYVYAGPASGPDAPTAFRALVNDDLPLSGVIAGAYGSGSSVPVVTVNSKGVITGITTASVTVASADWSTLTNVPATVTDVAGLTPADGAFIVGDGTDFITESGSTARTSLGAAASGANSDITSLAGITGGISSPDFIQFDAALSPLPTDATAKLYYNNEDQFQTLAFQMNGNVVQKIGEEQFFRIKCQGAVTKGQVVSFAGTVGVSGGLIGKAATGLTAEQSNYILGIAAETGANNDWIFVTYFGEVKGLDTTGGAESWVDGTILYYNPAVTGGLTKNKPTAPNAIAIVAAVVHADASNGILFIRPTYGSVLGDTDGNVQFGTLSNGDVIVYDGTDLRWENVAQSALAVGAATNISGGTAGALPYNTGAGATTFLSLGLADYVLTAGASAPQYVAQSTLSVGSATNVAGGTAGAVPYNTGAGATTFLSLGATGAVLVAGATAPEYAAQSTLAVGAATNLSGGTASQIPYQTGAGATSFIANGTAGQVLLSNGTSAPAWGGVSGGIF